MTTIERVNEEWSDKVAAQQRHEHLAATVRIAIGELCSVAEGIINVYDRGRIYGVTEMLEAQLKAGDVGYTAAECSR